MVKINEKLIKYINWLNLKVCAPKITIFEMKYNVVKTFEEIDGLLFSYQLYSLFSLFYWQTIK